MKQETIEQLPVGTRITYKDDASRDTKAAFETWLYAGTAFVHSYVHINERTHEKYGGLCKYKFRDDKKPFWAVRFVKDVSEIKSKDYLTVPADEICTAESCPRYKVCVKVRGDVGWSELPFKVLTFVDSMEAGRFAKQLANWYGATVRLGHDLTGNCNDNGRYIEADFGYVPAFDYPKLKVN